MGKTDELIRNAGASIAQSASFRPAPVAMPALSGTNRVGDSRRDGLRRSQDFWFIPIERIDRDPNQPREVDFDQATSEEPGEGGMNPDFARLVASLNREGLLQPITVVHSDQHGRYRVLIGERRFRAASILGWKEIAAKLVELDPEANPGDPLAKQVIENVIRADLKPIEQARAFRTLLDVHKWTLAELGMAVGYSQGLISQKLRLLDVSSEIRAKVESGVLDANSAYHASKIADPVKQTEIAERIVSEGLTRDQAKDLVRDVMDKEPAKPSAKGSKAKGRGASKGKPKLPTTRTIKTEAGLKVTIEGRKGFDSSGLLAALEEALAKVRAEIQDDQVVA